MSSREVFIPDTKERKQLAPVLGAALRLRRAEEKAEAARVELAGALVTAHRRDAFSVRELADVVGLSATATYALLKRKNGGKP
jgi:hypothetical protein